MSIYARSGRLGQVGRLEERRDALGMLEEDYVESRLDRLSDRIGELENLYISDRVDALENLYIENEPEGLSGLKRLNDRIDDLEERLEQLE